MRKQAHISKNRFCIFSAAVQSFRLSKFATRLMAHQTLLYLCSLLLLYGDIESNLCQEIAKLIYHHFVTGTLIAYQHI